LPARTNAAAAAATSTLIQTQAAWPAPGTAAEAGATVLLRPVATFSDAARLVPGAHEAVGTAAVAAVPSNPLSFLNEVAALMGFVGACGCC
jgi:hypothetical protein